MSNTPKWTHFVDISDRYPPRKTKIFHVVSKDSGFPIGMITWYGPFRKYSFFPVANTVFEATCMQDISVFLIALMTEWKANRVATVKDVYSGMINEKQAEIIKNAQE